MKKVILCLLLSASSIYGSDNFWGNKQRTKYVSRAVTFSEGLNIQLYNEMFSKTQTELRREYIRDAEKLLKAGATGAEAEKMVLKFDDRVFDKQTIAKYGMANILGPIVKSGFNTFYNEFEEIGGARTVEFVTRDPDYKLHINWGIGLKTRKSQATVYLIAEMKNIHKDISRSWIAQGTVKELQNGLLGYKLAYNILFSLHKTRFPFKTQIYGRSIQIPGRYVLKQIGGISIPRIKEMAHNRCVDRGERLITKREIQILFSRGSLDGGYDQAKHQWITEDAWFDSYNSHGNETFYGSSALNHRAYYFCVNDGQRSYYIHH